MNFVRLSSIVSAIAAVAGAQAITVSYDLGAGGTSAPKFDVANSTLNSVSIVFGASGSDVVTLTRTNSGQNGTIHYDFNVKDTFTLKTTGGTVLAAGTSAPVSDFLNIPKGNTKKSTLKTSVSGVSSGILTDAAILSYFTGVGNASLLFGGSSLLTVTNPAGLASSGSVHTPTFGSGTITYDYSIQAVPEPASMAALGLGAFGFLKRRKKA